MKQRPLLMPDISYSFILFMLIPLVSQPKVSHFKDDFSIDIKEYHQSCDGIILAKSQRTNRAVAAHRRYQKLIAMHPDAVVVIDEAYIDYADDVKQASAVRLIRQFDNLVITQTFQNLVPWQVCVWAWHLPIQI